VDKITEFQGEYRWLSNFEPVQVEYCGIVFPTVENAFQAAKCSRPYDMPMFLAISPGQAKRLGRKVDIRSDWDDIKRDIMYGLTVLKYKNPVLRAKLISTGTMDIEEGNQWGDRYWGMVNGVGENHLGKIIMRVRGELIA
jgi:ribA/ribD-fused uncharacterized protein